MSFRPIADQPLEQFNVPFVHDDAPLQVVDAARQTGALAAALADQQAMALAELQQVLEQGARDFAPLSDEAMNDALSVTEAGDWQLNELLDDSGPPRQFMSTQPLTTPVPPPTPAIPGAVSMIAQRMKEGYVQLFRGTALFQTLAPSAPMEQVKVHLEHVLKVVQANPEIQWHEEHVRASFFPESLLHILGLALTHHAAPMPLMPALPATCDLPPLPLTSHADRLRLYIQTMPRPEDVFWSDAQAFITLWDEWNHKKLWWICQQLKASPVYFSAIKDILVECAFFTDLFVDQLYEECRQVHQRKRVAEDDLHPMAKR